MFISRHAQAELTKAEAQAKADANSEQSKMTEWLQRLRLPHHADTIARIAGRNAALNDLQFLTEDDIAEIGAMRVVSSRCVV